MGEGSVAVAVFEDERWLGEDWRNAIAEAPGLEAAPEVFERLSELDRWIEEQEDAGRPWLVVSDLDVTASDVPERYGPIGEPLAAKRPVIADVPGIVLVEWLRKAGRLNRVLVVTGVDWGPVLDYLEEVGCRNLLKPVWPEEVVQEVRRLAAPLRGRNA